MRQGSVENPTIRLSDFWSKCSSVRDFFLHVEEPRGPRIVAEIGFHRFVRNCSVHLRSSKGYANANVVVDYLLDSLHVIDSTHNN